MERSWYGVPTGFNPDEMGVEGRDGPRVVDDAFSAMMRKVSGIHERSVPIFLAIRTIYVKRS
jgi:hypothetical protein